MSSPQPWPALPEEDRWAVELMDERLERTEQTREEVLARARELRAEAAASEIKGLRAAALALADRYEQAAAARVAST